MTDVAAAFGITLKTLREDLSVLWMCGMPGLTPGDLIDIDMDAVDGEGVIHLSNADYLTRRCDCRPTRRLRWCWRCARCGKSRDQASAMPSTAP